MAHFIKEEAEAKVGRWVRTKAEFAGIPRGHTGQVTRADYTGQKLISGTKVDVWDVVIQWDWPHVHDDSFTKDEYEQFLEEVST